MKKSDAFFCDNVTKGIRKKCQKWVLFCLNIKVSYDIIKKGGSIWHTHLRK